MLNTFSTNPKIFKIDSFSSLATLSFKISLLLISNDHAWMLKKNSIRFQAVVCLCCKALFHIMASHEQTARAAGRLPFPRVPQVSVPFSPSA